MSGEGKGSKQAERKVGSRVEQSREVKSEAKAEAKKIL